MFGSSKKISAKACSGILLLFMAAGGHGVSVCQSSPGIGGVERASGAVVPIVCLIRTHHDGRAIRYRSVGTGFFVGTSGTFVTAAHVLANFTDSTKGNVCRAAVAFSPATRKSAGREHWSGLPASAWESAPKNVQWFPFDSAACHKNHKFDVAVCKTIRDLTRESISHGVVAISTVRPTTGTNVFFVGYGRQALDSTAVSASIAGVPPSDGSYALEIDKSAWLGASGSPIFASDGTNVVGMIIKTGIGETSGRSFGVASDAIRTVLEEAGK